MKKKQTLSRIFGAVLVLGGLALLILRIPPVVLTWETASEVGTAGFNIYRQVKDDGGEMVQANTELIEAAGDELTGASYRFEDEQVRTGTEYTYRIEEVEWDGATSMFPEAVTVRAGLPSYWVKIEGGLLLILGCFLIWRSLHNDEQPA